MVDRKEIRLSLDSNQSRPNAQRGNVTGDRQAMLKTIRAALSTPTKSHVSHESVEFDIRGSLPPVPADWDERSKIFETRSTALKTVFFIVDNFTQMQKQVAAIIAHDIQDAPQIATPKYRFAYQDDPLVTQVAESLDESSRLKLVPPFDGQRLGNCPIGITSCEGLIAQTGSVLISSSHTGGRALSVFPPHHIVLATADKLMPDLVEAYALIRTREATGRTSMTSLITGPSRTGDIERILVLGAHGPKKLTVILGRFS